MNYFVTAIGTDSGKTLVSSILLDALQADYYKPIQSGTESIDHLEIERLCTNDYCIVHPPQYLLKNALSPHHAAQLEGLEIRLADLQWPETTNTLVVEGAGGLMVPLNYKGEFMIDIIQSIPCEVVLVINTYLGCINHSLLSINELKNRNIKVKGIVFNGNRVPETENLILQYSGYKCLLRIDQEPEIGHEVIKKYALKLMANFHEY